MRRFIIIKGSGYFQVDNECFEVKWNSVSEVVPNGKCSIHILPNKPAIYLRIAIKLFEKAYDK
jgi:hypothetical protein